ncbi:MAG: ATP-dependent DNA helicase RecG, partial [Chloroflexi bacterium]|nr:ATP-dependent DNA helicase RecG [Chloroflexota bacterium]
DKKQRSEFITRLQKWVNNGEVLTTKAVVIPFADSKKLDVNITTLKGISSALYAKFSRLGIKTIRDMLYFFPRRHIDYSKTRPISELEIGIEQTVVGFIWEVSTKPMAHRRIKLTEAILGDDTGNIRVVWFNQPYMAKVFKTNSRVAVSGKVVLYMGRKQFESPEYEILTSDDFIHTGRLVPVYPLTEGLYGRTVRRLVKETVNEFAPSIPDFLPVKIQLHADLIPLAVAIEQAHYPDNELLKDKSRKRLAFDELFLIQLGVLSRKLKWQKENPGYKFNINQNILKTFDSKLPFELTPAQQKALQEIIGDLSKSVPMSRLLQGDVGSGKTVVACEGIVLAIANGFQAAFMAPTEILAEQHYGNVCRLLGGNPSEGSITTFESILNRSLTVCLLMGSIKKSEKKKIYESIASGEVNIIIGTHALIQEDVEFNKLGLVIVDEQHRFGVMQRSALREKGISPHLLVMSATPIPRTLALTIYGDLDISIINKLPPGRQKIITRFIGPEKRGKAYDFVREQIKSGRQAFVVCPLIDESEAIDAKAAVTEYNRLSTEIYPEFHLGLLHGRMSPNDKDEVMTKFRQGELNVLVSTSVVEVGIDVPNATVMLIEGADRFGLSQLHQFRGRVGRGSEKSYCILLSESPSNEAKERLEILERVNDGFVLAEEDLRLRGAGEFFGTRQSGMPDLRMAKLSDTKLIELARQEAIILFKEDPDLKKPEYTMLAKEVAKWWSSAGELS